jgi:hypothetical protein
MKGTTMACTRGRRQPFSCGHKGYGKICHRCKQADAREAQWVKDNPKSNDAECVGAALLRKVPGKVSPVAGITQHT